MYETIDISEATSEMFIKEWMPRVKGKSREALVAVLSKKKTVMDASRYYEVSHQSIRQNMLRIEKIQQAIKNYPSS